VEAEAAADANEFMDPLVLKLRGLPAIAGDPPSRQFTLHCTSAVPCTEWIFIFLAHCDTQPARKFDEIVKIVS
jgi:hypothetical protein